MPRPPRSLIEKTYRLERFTEFDRGGYFAALEQPDLFFEEVSGFVREVRRGGFSRRHGAGLSVSR